LQLRDYGKTARANREISIPQELAEELIALGPEGFRSVRGCDITRIKFRREWVKAQKAAGIIDLARVHDIRHTAISRWANAGIPLSAVRDRAGHTDLSTTSRYIHTIDGDDNRFLALAS
jgi:integrase